MLSKSWFPKLVAHLFLQSESGEVAEMPAEIYRSPESLGAAAICMGDVLATARLWYGSPWISALQIPRPATDLFIFYAPIRSGLAYSFYGFPISGSQAAGRYRGEPRMDVGQSTYGGITEGCWCAFTQNAEVPPDKVFGGEFSTVEVCLRPRLAFMGYGKKSPP